MTDPLRYLALLFGVLVVAVLLVGGWVRERAAPARAAEVVPVVGRPASEVARDPAGAFATVRTTAPADREALRRQEAAKELDALLGGLAWPGPYRRLVVHPILGDPGAVSGEEGPPWHLVLDAEGRIEVTSRLRSGRPGVPEGFPANEGRKALHVLVAHAGTMTEDRRQRLAALLQWLCRKLGLEAGRVVLAGETPGLGRPLPPGISRETLLPPEWRR